MKKNIIAFMVLLLGGLAVQAHTFNDETLRYVVQYKWGLVQKDSGDATLHLRNHSDHYDIQLTGKTRSWADKFYVVRDTLRSKIHKTDFKPLSYERIAHEGGNYNRDILTYQHNGSNTSGRCERFKRTKKGVESSDVKEFTSSGPTFDMASIFYYLRTLDFADMKVGQVKKMTMFSGSKKETLTLKYMGKKTIKLRDKSSREAYHISFSFTTEGSKKSSDDIDAWISTDSSRIPLLVEGSLKVGKIRCLYVGS